MAVAMSWGTEDMFFIRRVTDPARALALEARNFSCPVGSASISRAPFCSDTGFWLTLWTAEARAPVSWPGLAATSATYPATSSAALPVRSLAGITPSTLGYWIQ